MWGKNFSYENVDCRSYLFQLCAAPLAATDVDMQGRGCANGAVRAVWLVVAAVTRADATAARADRVMMIMMDLNIMTKNVIINLAIIMIT